MDDGKTPAVQGKTAATDSDKGERRGTSRATVVLLILCCAYTKFYLFIVCIVSFVVRDACGFASTGGNGHTRQQQSIDGITIYEYEVKAVLVGFTN